MSHRVLVTGAGGLVGAEVCSELLVRGHEVVALVHRGGRPATATGELFSPRLEIVRGDVTDPGVVGPGDREALARVDTIVHCAATTDFAAPRDLYDRLNVGGTGNVIALASDLDARLVMVSTAYVCGRFDAVAGHAAVFTEDMLDEGQGFGNGYEESKLRAESLVRSAAADGLRTAIVRPGIVCGAATDGRLREYRNIYLVLKLITEGKLTTLPGRYGATLAPAPIDFVADVIGSAVDAGATDRTFHAVGADALSLRDVSDVLSEYPCFRVNRFVPAAGFSPRDLGRRERMYYERIGRDYVSYFDRSVRFDTSGTRELLAAHGHGIPGSGPDLLRLLLDECLTDGFLADDLPDPDAVLARTTNGAGP